MIKITMTLFNQLEKQVNKGEISKSRMIEILNGTINPYYQFKDCPNFGMMAWEKDSEAFECWNCGFEKQV